MGTMHALEGIPDRGRFSHTTAQRRAVSHTWILLKANGQVHNNCHDPGSFFAQLKQHLKKAPTKDELKFY